MTRRSFGHIKPLPSGGYRATYTYNYRQYTAPGIFPQKNQAATWLATQQAQIAAGEWTPPSRTTQNQKPKKLTLTAYTEQWLAAKQAEQLTAKTLHGYRSNIEKWILPTLGHHALTEISKETVLDWWNHLTGGPGAKTKAYTYLRMLLNAAQTDGHIKENPCQIRGIKTKTRGAKAKQRAELIATPKQIEAITSHMPAPLAIAVTLGYWCALRYGEMAELRRKDIDLKAGTLTISRAYQYAPGTGTVIGPPKTEAGRRTVAIPTKIIPTLKAHLDTHVEPGRDALIVHATTNTTRNLPSSTFHRAYKHAISQAAPELEGFDYHGLRHSGLTLYGQAGATIAELQARAGHANADMVAIYQHATKERDRMIVEAMTNPTRPTLKAIQ